jgi:hypothetical protein
VTVDVTRYAGQNVELSFQTAGESIFEPDGQLYGPHNIDDIQFYDHRVASLAVRVVRYTERGHKLRFWHSET